MEDDLKHLGLFEETVVEDTDSPESFGLAGVELHLAGGLATEVFISDGGSVSGLDACTDTL